jgi:hypothetical protein
MASVYRQQGKHAKAVEFFAEALVIYEDKLGTEDRCSRCFPRIKINANTNDIEFFAQSQDCDNSTCDDNSNRDKCDTVVGLDYPSLSSCR